MDWTSNARDLKSLFTSRIRLAILTHLAFETNLELGVRDLARKLNEDYKNVSRELANLAELGLVTFNTEGARKNLNAEPILRGTLMGELWSVLMFQEPILTRINQLVVQLSAPTLFIQPHRPGIVLITLEPGADGEEEQVQQEESWPLFIRRLDPALPSHRQDVQTSLVTLPTLVIRGNPISMVTETQVRLGANPPPEPKGLVRSARKPTPTLTMGED